MIFEEDREGTGGAFGARIKDRNFLNGARHSVYYKRTENTSSSILMVNYICIVFIYNHKIIMHDHLYIYKYRLIEIQSN